MKATFSADSKLYASLMSDLPILKNENKKRIVCYDIIFYLYFYGKIIVSLAPHRCGFESRPGLWILSCEVAIQLAYGTSVVLLRCPFVPEIMHGRAPEVFLHQ
jgi:hypothetical protein